MSSEKTITIVGAGDRAGAMVSEHVGIAGVKEAAIEFTKVTDYTTFDAEWSMVGDNMVFHFFMPSGHRVTEHYWLEVFAKALNETAQTHFGATLPRLMAKYTEELKSWWFKAQGYNHIIDKDAYVDKFFGMLDDTLDDSFVIMSQPKTLSRTSHE